MIKNDEESEQLSFVRITELLNVPELIKGSYDSEHLRKIHEYIFQDSPHHNPGVFRNLSNTSNKHWGKTREIITENISYPIYYYSGENIEREIEKAISIRKPIFLQNLSKNDFSETVADLYGKLDHIHPFFEGNSRTLRFFTYLLSLKSGHLLDWNTTNLSSEIRDRLYKARDYEVIRNHFPSIAQTNNILRVDPIQYECYHKTYVYLKDCVKLEEIIKENVYKKGFKPKM